VEAEDLVEGAQSVEAVAGLAVKVITVVVGHHVQVAAGAVQLLLVLPVHQVQPLVAEVMELRLQ
jgi:hypothetical protein